MSLRRIRYIAGTGLRLAYRPRAELVRCSALVATVATVLALMCGILRGEVQALLAELLKSPSARVVEVWAAREEAAIGPAEAGSLKQSVPELELLIPSVRKVGVLLHPSRNTTAGATLVTTLPGDPLLAFHNARPPRPDSREVLLVGALARALDAKADDEIVLRVARSEGRTERSAEAVLRVCGVVELGEQEGLVAFVDLGLTDRIETWQQGHALPELGWPAADRPVPASFRRFIAIARRPLDEQERWRLRARGLKARPIAVDDGAQGLDLLRKVFDLSGLHLAWIEAAGTDEATRLAMPATEIESITEQDDVVLPWCAPRLTRLQDEELAVLPAGGELRWLKSRTRAPQAWFAPGERALRLRPLGGAGATGPATIGAIPLSVDASQTRPDGPAVGLVPADVLALTELLDEGKVAWDEIHGAFTGISSGNRYYRARAYARGIYEVPALDRRLRDLGYTTRSERDRIQEIRTAHERLERLVAFAAAGLAIALAGIVFVELLGVTARLRGAIGIMRAVGMPRSGIALLVLTRAAATAAVGIAFMAACSETGAALLGAAGLPCRLTASDVALVAALCATSCALGAAWPAWTSARLDPAAAITESRIQ